MDPPSPDRFDFSIPQRCFEVGNSSNPPEDEDVNHVLPESVVLRSNNAVIPVVEPAVQPRIEIELSRFVQGYYNNDYMIEAISEGNEEEEEIMEVDIEGDTSEYTGEYLDDDVEIGSVLGIDSEEDPEEDPEENQKDQEQEPDELRHLLVDHENSGMQFMYPSPPTELEYPPLTDAEWEALYVEYGLRENNNSRYALEDAPPLHTRRRRRSSLELHEIKR